MSAAAVLQSSVCLLFCVRFVCVYTYTMFTIFVYMGVYIYIYSCNNVCLCIHTLRTYSLSHYASLLSTYL